MKSTSRQSAAPRAVSAGIGNLELPILMVVLIVLIAAGFLVGLGPVEGAPAQTPWQELGPASTAH